MELLKLCNFCIHTYTNNPEKNSSISEMKSFFFFISLPCSNPFITRALNDICYEFIWDQKPDKLNKKQLCTNNQEAGLKMIDTDSFIKGMKVSWIHYLNIETTPPWVQLAKHIVGDIDKVLLFGSDWAFQRVKQIN